MEDEIKEGKISFVHHDKHYVTIEYTHNGKKKSINGKVDQARQQQLKEQKLIKKVHRFHEGDEVYFTPERSARGDKMVAEKIRYRFNDALGNLVNRADTENRFVGYLKFADNTFFVKETGSYLFFPLVLSRWELPPDTNKLNEPVFFSLQNTRNPDKLTATLYKQHFIPQFVTAQKYFNSKATINATVYKVSPHGIYVNVIGDKIQAKIPLPQTGYDKAAEHLPKNGDLIPVIITYLSPEKIVVNRV
ncbi:MAG: hypothetical protein NVSMB7_16530 [Chitinophagaceae bacterium]